VNQENEAKVKAKTLQTCAESHVSFLTVFGPADISEELSVFARDLD